MGSKEEYIQMLEQTVEKFGEPWKTLPIETVVEFISDYEVVSSEATDGMKILKLVGKG